jgi:hypothetical protein
LRHVGAKLYPSCLSTVEGGNREAIRGIGRHSPEKPACYRKRVSADRAGGGLLIQAVSDLRYSLYLTLDTDYIRYLI